MSRKPLELGDLVRTMGSVGRLIATNGKYATVEFFDSPGRDGTVRDDVPVSAVASTVLEKQTRVWWRDEGVWKIGRVVAGPDDRDDRYVIALPKLGSQRLYADQFSVRWSRPMRDPLQALIAGAVESRMIYEARIGYLREIMAFDEAFDGLSGIASSAVELYSHQVNAARRVLLDPVRRYLLADEVGLGKTIEAGFVIRQTMLDIANSRILVIAPDHLVPQWRTELRTKFSVDKLNGGDVQVSTLSEFIDRPPSDLPAMVVIDEAHTFSRHEIGPERFDAVRSVAHAAPGLLLLSATPVRTNETAFLEMLHLLDPASWNLSDEAEFRRRLDQRSEVASAVFLLDATAGSSRVLQFEAAQRLADAFPDDKTIHVLARSILDNPDDDSPTVDHDVKQLRNYVSETYRLHRRLIRNRRSDASVRLGDGFAVRGRSWSKKHWLIDPDPRRRSVLEALEQFRIALSELEIEATRDALRIATTRCFAGAIAVREFAGAIRDGALHELPELEHAIFQEPELEGPLADLVDGLLSAVGSRPSPDLDVLRLDALCDYVWAGVDVRKYAAFTSFTSVAKATAARMEQRFGRRRVAAMHWGMDPEALRDAADRAENDPLCTLLVCDATVEEGWNLQFIDEIVHLDLPWSVNRIEQRIGRFDRPSIATSRLAPVSSTVVVDEEGLGLSRAWIDFIDTSTQVFTRSTAILQYILPEFEDENCHRVLDRGFFELADLADAERDRLEGLRREIVNQDLLDSTGNVDEELEFYARLERIEEDEAVLDRAIDQWVVHALCFKRNTSGGVQQFGISKKAPPLLTEREIRRIDPRVLANRYSVSRRSALNHPEAELLRPGNALIDGCLDIARRCDRGVCFASFMDEPRLPAGQTFGFICLDFIVGPSIEPLRGVPAEAWSALRRTVARFMPSRVERVWWTLAKAEEAPEGLRRGLENSSVLDNLASDPEKLNALMSAFDWEAECEAARLGGERIVANRPEVAALVLRAREMLQQRIDAAVIRDALRAKEFAEDAAADPLLAYSAALLECVSNPAVSLAGSGVVFVGSPA